MKLLLGAIIFAAGLFLALHAGDPNGHWCARNLVAGVTGGLIGWLGLNVALEPCGLAGNSSVPLSYT